MAAASLSRSCLPRPRLSLSWRNELTQLAAAPLASDWLCFTTCVDTACKQVPIAAVLSTTNCRAATRTAFWQLLRLVAGGDDAAHVRPATNVNPKIPRPTINCLNIRAPFLG